MAGATAAWWLRVAACALVVLAGCAPGSGTESGLAATLSNTELPRDTQGNLLLTGEASVLSFNETYYFYFNNWGGCPGVDCCTTADGCASCCFHDKSWSPPDACVYTNNHSIVAYSTRDLTTWEFAGEMLGVQQRPVGIEFRPSVVYNAATKQFVMWYEDRGTGPSGYSVAVAPGPLGPFKTVGTGIAMPGKGRIGDFNIFVDDDGKAYHVRTGFDVVLLNDSYTGPTTTYTSFSVPRPSEGPIFFKRGSTYYIGVGTGCCACRGGSSIYMLTSETPLGPYTYRGDVGSNKTPFDKHSPHNYVTNAQASSIFAVPDSNGNKQYVWLGNQWVTSTQPGRPRNHDLLYWSILNFDAQGNVTQFVHTNSITLDIGTAPAA